MAQHQGHFVKDTHQPFLWWYETLPHGRVGHMWYNYLKGGKFEACPHDARPLATFDSPHLVEEYLRDFNPLALEQHCENYFLSLGRG